MTALRMGTGGIKFEYKREASFYAIYKWQNYGIRIEFKKKILCITF
jgi:hypothetical protein